MKICQLLHAMTTGGAEVLADRMGRHFAKSHDVVYACLDGVGEIGERLQADGFLVHDLGRGEGIDFGCMKRLARFLKDQEIDLIHAHQYTPFFYAAAARWMAKGQPVVFTEHGRFHPDYPSWKRGLFNRLMLRKSDRVIAVGRQVKQALIDNESLPSKRVEVIYNGIDLEPFLNAGRNGDNGLRQELQLGELAIIVAQVARLDPIKDHVTAVRAMAAAVRALPELHLVIVGDGPARGVIESEIRSQGIGSNVHMLGLRSDVPAILKQSQILLLTSVSEGIPLTLIEGMASGIPCVSTDVGGIAEVVSDGETGLLVPSGDVTALADAVVRLGEDPERRTELAKTGKAQAIARFSEQQMMQAYDQLFEQILPRH